MAGLSEVYINRMAAVLPVVKMLAAPLLRDKIRAQKAYFSQPSGE